MDSERKRLRELDKTIFNVSKDLSLNLINPSNSEAEKKKFFRDPKHEPFFRYDKLKVGLKKLFEVLASLKFKESVMDTLFKDKAVELANFINLIHSRGTPKFTQHSIKIYGKPDKELIDRSKTLIAVSPSQIYQSPRMLSSKEALKEFREAMKFFGDGWEIKEENIVANAMVVPEKRQLLIKKDTPFSLKQVKRFIAHEIYGHVLRAQIGLFQPYRIFSIGLAKYDETEEGLALYKERVAGLLDSRILKGYAGRVLAIDIALNSGFRDTYLFLRKFYSREKAWTLTVRVKRGLGDTSLHGAFTKDLIYLKGYFGVLNFLEHNSLKSLHYGKVSVLNAPYMSSIRGLTDPDRILRDKFKNPDGVPKKLFW
ncbi:DUF1704 domain-containing protein [Candidatus Woesearchaeota archaeon]|nr:DUF1704 domain-containing protein [Candidatus Woesearchaeota archaeon]